MALETVFEKETCSRCGGCGQYSYNQVDGSRCYGCGGKGERLTKRGAAASQFFRNSCMVELGSITIGDIIEVEQMSADCRSRLRYFSPVVEISEVREIAKSKNFATGEWEPIYGITVSTEHAKYGKSGIVAKPDHMVRKGQSAEDRAAKIAAALEYQATLTKTGAPRKR